jgi:hypothetical protein
LTIIENRCSQSDSWSEIIFPPALHVFIAKCHQQQNPIFNATIKHKCSAGADFHSDTANSSASARISKETIFFIFYKGQGAPWEVEGHKGALWWQKGVAPF